MLVAAVCWLLEVLDEVRPWLRLTEGSESGANPEAKGGGDIRVYTFSLFSITTIVLAVKIATRIVARTCVRRVRGGTGRGGASFTHSQHPPILLKVGEPVTTIACGSFGGSKSGLYRGGARGGKGRIHSSDSHFPPILLGAGRRPAKTVVGGGTALGKGGRVHGGTS